MWLAISAVEKRVKEVWGSFFVRGKGEKKRRFRHRRKEVGTEGKREKEN